MTKRRALAATASAALAVLAFHVAVRHSDRGSSVAFTAVPTAHVPAVYRALRPKYPFSVIPGGAYSPAELRMHSGNDPVVRAHYAGFDLSRAQLLTTVSDRYQYVSFRLKNQVFWTHKKLRIPKGEVLLTDGTNYARTRCGNRLSDTPLSPTTKSEPSDTALSLPPYELGGNPNLPLADALETDALPAQNLPINSVLFSPAFVLAEDTYLHRPTASPYLFGNPAMFWPGPGYLSGFSGSTAGKTSASATSTLAGVSGPGIGVVPVTPVAIPEPGTIGFLMAALCLWLLVTARSLWRSARRSASSC